MKAIFITVMNGAPHLPPIEDFNGGTQLLYTENGANKGGFTITDINNTEEDRNIICEGEELVLHPGKACAVVDASAETIEAMKSWPDCTWVKDLPED